MKFLSLSSGSKGNASYLECGNIKALIDVGISYSLIKEGLEKNQINIKDITHVFITHEHTDHIKGLSMLLKHANPRVYVTLGTNEQLKLKEYHLIEPLKEVSIGGLSVIPIPLSHDALEPVGFVFKYKDKSICYITDTGYILNDLKPYLENHTLYYLESNHDPYTLLHSKRPYHLIRRIMNEKGHLSNEDSAYYFSQLAGDKTRYLIHAHMSLECNNEDIINHTFKEVLMAHGLHLNTYIFLHAKQNISLEMITL